MVVVKLENLQKSFGSVVAVDNISLTIEESEFFTILGPSGCGKTTTLRMIAGFYKPDKGKIYFNSKEVHRLPPEKRNTGMVFQNYALWPHMTVFKNVAFGLEMRKLSKENIKSRVESALDLVDLEGLGDRTPDQLSGGQQQRVALARALVIEPDVLLLDEHMIKRKLLQYQIVWQLWVWANLHRLEILLRYTRNHPTNLLLASSD
jgi:iron(III) transport system ATP-binding protein